MKQTLAVLVTVLAPLAVHAADPPSTAADADTVPDRLVLNYHLMHPGGKSGGAGVPSDPYGAFHLDGVYHLHYILAHPWQKAVSFSFVHVTSPDMLHWTWQTTKLQPAFTRHGMFSGTGFMTREGQPAIIYHGAFSERNQIAVAKDRRLSGWEKPYVVDVKNADGSETEMRHWDPDCFVIGDTYYAIAGGEQQPLFNSRDLKFWTYVGDFLSHQLPGVTIGDDISCPNFFRLGNKWMLLCISHMVGCRYYIGEWDAQGEQFVPEQHGFLNWRREDQGIWGRPPWRVDYFAPESVLTPDGRRVAWAWCATLGQTNDDLNRDPIQSLPREFSLPDDGVLRIKPLRELESLRYDPVTFSDVEIRPPATEVHLRSAPAGQKIATLGCDAVEVRITINREQAVRKLFGFTLFPDGKGGGLPILFRPENGTLRVGTAEAPFSIDALPQDEDVTLRIFVDKYVVEVFANDRQAMIARHDDFEGRRDLTAFTIGAPATLKTVEIWKLKPTNEGFLQARKDRIWEPATK